MAFNTVSPDYFSVLGMQLLSGRLLTHMDGPETDSVIVVNESLANAYFENGDAVGSRMSFSFDGQYFTPRARIVGVVADAREYGIERPGIHTVYRPADQLVWGSTLLIATGGDPAALTGHVRQVVRSLDSDRPVDQIQMLDELRSENVAPSRLNATLFGAFAGLALVIAGIGVLGVLAFSVSQRIREFGIRMALGADRTMVLRSVLAEGVLMVSIALAAGVGASIVLGRFLSGMLFSVQPFDLASLCLAAILLGSVTLIAAFLPAVRATSVRPAEALRAE